ncbi:MAG: histidine--tRNA ligase [Planctomycetota bacterium]|nr:MAG: histidine--tRNA ligase [Planctomycetota bacterium]
MKIPPVKGTRDFYPADMAVRNWMIDGWKKVSLRNGFEEYDGPIFEYLKMFQLKSGDEIVEQLFSLKDRGGRELAIRPEITPTLARMVNQKISSLPKPIKWFSVPRLCRAERPQRGRLREFFQWNIDIIGVDDVLADAETIFCALDYLQEVGLTPNDIVVKISNRKMLAAILQSIGISQGELEPLYAVLDKRDKLPQEAFEEMLTKQVGDENKRTLILKLMTVESIEQISSVVELSKTAKESVDELGRLFELLDVMGAGDFCVFDIGIVRGLAYYTGIVYEIYDKESELRAIGGGGRYDNLLKQFGGPNIPATGFGVGDCVLAILLEEKGLLKPKPQELDYFITFVSNITFNDKEGNIQSTPEDEMVKLTAKLRRLGLKADFSYKLTESLSKKLKEASTRNAQKCIIIGEEFKDNQLSVKDMATGQQELVDINKFLAEVKLQSR